MTTSQVRSLAIRIPVLHPPYGALCRMQRALSQKDRHYIDLLAIEPTYESRNSVRIGRERSIWGQLAD